jgi:hypothetical protein
MNIELGAKFIMQAIGSLAIAVLKYIFGIINWNQEEVQNWIQKQDEC